MKHRSQNLESSLVQGLPWARRRRTATAPHRKDERHCHRPAATCIPLSPRPSARKLDWLLAILSWLNTQWEAVTWANHLQDGQHESTLFMWSLLSNCYVAATTIDENCEIDNLLLRKLQWFALPPSPPRRDGSTGVLAAGTQP
jgi:hypothetical protein